MTVKEFVSNFDINHPDWSEHPPGNPYKWETSDLSGEEIIKLISIKSLWELREAEKPKQTSRTWNDPEGYKYLAVWQNAALLRVMIRVFTKGLPAWEKRLKAQLDDAARSQKRNIEEGWKRATTGEYLRFISFAQGSLEEVKGDIRDAKTDGFLPSRPLSTLKDIGIDLRVVKGVGKGMVKGEPTDPSHPYFKPLMTLKPTSLTYEMFMELIYKTDYLLRMLVQSLEHKQNQEKMKLL